MKTSLSDVGAIELRLVFRKLYHSGKVKVDSTPEFNDPDRGLTDAQWIGRSQHGKLVALIEKHGAVEAALAISNGITVQEVVTEFIEDAVPTSEKVEAEVKETKPDTAKVVATDVQGAVVAAGGAADGMAVLAAAISPYLKLGIDEKKIAQMVKDTVKAVIDGTDPKVLEIRTPTAVKHMTALRHKNFEKLMKLSGARIHTMLIGPAGTGKSHAAGQVAEALDLRFFSESVGPQTTQAGLLGYRDAMGKIVRTSFREAYEFGGVFCLDEVDAGSPAVLTVLNSALSNGQCGFPDGMVAKHENFVLIGTANTWGNGRSLEYNGRNALDAAFLNRFARLPWGEDEKMEKAFVKVGVWVKYVQTVRKLFRDQSIKAVISPRTSELGSRALEAGMSVSDTIECFVRCGLSEEANKVLDRVQVPTVMTVEAP